MMTYFPFAEFDQTQTKITNRLCSERLGVCTSKGQSPTQNRTLRQDSAQRIHTLPTTEIGARIGLSHRSIPDVTIDLGLYDRSSLSKQDLLGFFRNRRDRVDLLAALISTDGGGSAPNALEPSQQMRKVR